MTSLESGARLGSAGRSQGRRRGESRAKAVGFILGMLLTVPAILAAIAFAIFGATRFVLTIISISEMPWNLVPGIVLRGVWFDLVTVGVILSPFLLSALVYPSWYGLARVSRWLNRAVIWLFTTALLFAAVGEFLFWKEFSTRFNFIAVDYLIYTREVVDNVVQSYPVGLLTTGVLAAATLITWMVNPWLRTSEATPLRVGTRLTLILLGLASPMLVLLADAQQPHGSGNTYAEELSENGLLTLVSAYVSNELDYERFYATLPPKRVEAILDELGIGRASAAAIGGNPTGSAAAVLPFYLERRPRNIVLITVESLSASFLGAYGDKRGLTPNLDRIAAQGLVFDRAFATGTRTVRGLEATSLGTPPVPGQAIVRRPHSDHLTTLGEVLAHQGFDSYFFYGGNSYFDNMAAYFGGNDYRVFDQADFDPKSIPSENAWGVADEALFFNLRRELSNRADNSRPFLAQVMTTSNHRPYTYPAGRIDIPSPGGREGAVKYTDYAIGRFLQMASGTRWFADTMFVIVADHCASVAGKVELPVADYHIPIIFFGPGIVKPGHVAEVFSQIDLPPTLLDAVGRAGTQYYFGAALGKESQSGGRAFVSTYQSLGYYREDLLTVLKPNREIESYHVDPGTFEMTAAPVDRRLRDEAIAYYQEASRAFRNGDLAVPWTPSAH
jgi:phosphoglycerol transferase MdoB-like AlkP superfamily enzyme